MSDALLELQAVGRSFDLAGTRVEVLRQLTLRIRAGEMLAIVGVSGSGKSTLMNILGCLDRPSSGRYLVNGIDTATLGADERARLRRLQFGFVFQRYHLLPHLDAVDNVAMPAVYAGMGLAARRERARALLERLGLGAHLGQHGNQLSGGQQQRVGIARALMNGGMVLLADEPTGALDSRSGQEVMAILRELNQQGHTVVIVTHDPRVAAATDRVIRLHDGELVSDTGPAEAHPSALTLPQASRQVGCGAGAEALRMAWLALCANRLRTLLTMLGIVIGIASVTVIVALGQGAKDSVLENIRAIGTRTIMVFRGQDWGDDKASSIETLLPADLKLLSREPYVDSVTPETSRPMRIRRGSADLEARVVAGGEQVFRVGGQKIVIGRGLSPDDVSRQAQVVVLDGNARRKLFAERQDVLGQVVMVGAMPAEVIGIAAEKNGQRMSDDRVSVWLPYSTAASRLFGQVHFDMLVLRASEGVPMSLVEQQVTRLLSMQHGRKDFFTHNLDRVYQSLSRIARTMTLLLSLVALISLLVGGIGVMNIMLVSVTERTREIGIRMAVGARQRDVLLQFLIESVLVCLVGGGLGIVLAQLLVLLFPLFVTAFTVSLSIRAAIVALGCSLLIGVLFGLMPARHAARLDPVEALARE